MAAVNFMGNETPWPGSMTTLEGATTLNAAPEPAMGEIVRLCGFGLKIDNVQLTTPPTRTRPKLIVPPGSGPVHGLVTVTTGPGITLALRTTLNTASCVLT